jgi:MarR family 2-MHQ and catechol resistance regulon transcriptional repressor
MPLTKDQQKDRKDQQKDQQLDRDAVRVYEALSDLVRVYQFRDRDKICCHDISVTQCYALEALARLGPRTLNELAAELYLDKSTASRVVATLARKGYVTRQAHPQDRRAILVDLTTSGQRLLTKIQRNLVEETRQLLSDFEPAVRNAAPVLLDRLARAAERRLAGTSGPPASAAACAC